MVGWIFGLCKRLTAGLTLDLHVFATLVPLVLCWASVVVIGFSLRLLPNVRVRADGQKS